jgi:hypothetical protein
LERFQSIAVLGSSAASSFKSEDQSKSWPLLLKNELPEEIQFNVRIRSGLTFVRSIPELIQDDLVDLFIFHFGTAIGWPNSVVKRGMVLGVNFTSEFGFHQSAFRSASRSRRIKAKLRAILRNSIKYALFFTGQYRTRINRREIEDQIQAVINLAQKKSKQIIWIQHQALQHRSIFVERRSYLRYYKEIIRCLEKFKSQNFIVVTLPESFLIQDNYLLDSVHLSEKGHQELHKLVREAYKRF